MFHFKKCSFGPSHCGFTSSTELWWLYFNIKSKVMKIFLVFVRQVACKLRRMRGIVLDRTAPGGYDNWSIVELVAIEDSFDIRKNLDKFVICLRSGCCGLGEKQSTVYLELKCFYMHPKITLAISFSWSTTSVSPRRSGNISHWWA